MKLDELPKSKIRFYDLEEASGIFCQAVQETEADLLVESYIVACAVASGETWDVSITKEQVLAYLANQSDRSRSTMNDRYKVGVLFPPERWLVSAPLKWTHYKICSELADLDDPSTWNDAHAMLQKAADEGWKTRHLKAVVLQRKAVLCRTTGKPPLSTPRMVVDALEGVFRGMRGDRMVVETTNIERLQKLRVGQRVLVSIMVLEERNA